MEIPYALNWNTSTVNQSSESNSESLKQNDNTFILSAVTSQIFDCIILVFPPWKPGATKSGSLMTEEIIRAGYYYPRSIGTSSPNNNLQFCYCYQTNYCFTWISNLHRNGRVPLHRCHVWSREVRLIRVYIEALTSSISHLSDSCLSSQHFATILNVDEDFFSSDTVVPVLVKAGIPEATITGLSQSLGSLYCPQTNGDEVALDAWFAKLLDNLPRIREEFCDKEDETYVCTDEQDQNYIHKFAKHLRNHFPKLQRSVVQNNSSSNTSGSFPLSFDRATELLWDSLMRLSTSQLKAIHDVGLCHSQTVHPILQLCIGSRWHDVRGNNTMVTSSNKHLPNNRELRSRFRLYRRLLYRLPRPSVMSLVRSTRTTAPLRSIQSKLEGKLISLMNNRVNSMIKRNPDYAPFLAGGSNGWSSRFS